MALKSQWPTENQWQISLSFTMELEHEALFCSLEQSWQDVVALLWWKCTENQPTQDYYSISKHMSTVDTRKA